MQIVTDISVQLESSFCLGENDREEKHKEKRETAKCAMKIARSWKLRSYSEQQLKEENYDYDERCFST